MVFAAGLLHNLAAPGPTSRRRMAPFGYAKLFVTISAFPGTDRGNKDAPTALGDSILYSLPPSLPS